MSTGLQAPVPLRGGRVRTKEDHLPYIDLLDNVAVSSTDDPAGFRRLRDGLREVRGWFAEHTDWAIQDTAEFIRLVKPPAGPRAGAGLPGGPHSARIYSFICWILWFGEKERDEQFSMTYIAKHIQDRATEVVAPHYIDWNLREHRAMLRAALEYLEQMGCVTLVNGDAREYVDQVGEADALYQFTELGVSIPVSLPDSLYHRLVIDRDTSAIAALTDHEGAVHFRAYRTLLLSSAVHMSTDPDALAYIKQQRSKIREQIEHHFGWGLEVTPSYAAILRPVHDVRGGRTVFPDTSSRMALPLLLSAAIRAGVAGGEFAPDPVTDSIALSYDRLTTLCSGIRGEYGAAWATELMTMNTTALVEEALSILQAWDFVHGPDAAGLWHIQATLGRYSGFYREDGVGLGSNFDAVAHGALDSRRRDPSPDDNSLASDDALQ
jgi:uncharacterized protein (TIGR02678 family)